MIRVLVVDDSALMRKMVTDFLHAYPEIQVVGQARDGADALSKIPVLKPDVITMDIEMPQMDGITALRKIMSTNPLPVIMLSSLTQDGAASTIKCLELGAFDFVGKPSGSISLDINHVAEELYHKVKAAASRKVVKPVPGPLTLASTMPSKKTAAGSRRGLVFIGSSTGGPRALHSVLPYLPADLGVPIIIVQHLPENFTTMLATRLNEICPFEVREAKDGDALKPGVALIAPGGKHLKFDHAGIARITAEPPVNGVRPAIDITMTSLIPLYGNYMVGVILTGMGKDGAASMKILHEKRGITLAESEETCVVYGMPKAAYELGAVTKMVRLENMANEIKIATASLSAAKVGGVA